MKTIKLTTILLLFSLCAMAGAVRPYQHSPDERRRVITKEFSVRPGEALSIDNQFGSVTVNLWERNSIKVDIRITANAVSESRAMAYLDAVQIDEERQGGKIMIKTVIGRGPFTKNIGGQRNSQSLQIDYTLYMPRETALLVKNQFGDTKIPTFHAPLTIDCRYGDLFSNALENVSNLIEMSYGSAKLGKVVGGKFDFKYADLELKEIVKLELKNKFGELKIEDVTNLQADIDYSNAKIGVIRGPSQIRLNYSSDFSIDELQSLSKTLQIDANYSSVELPAQANRFKVSVTHGNFSYPAGKASFTVQPEKGIRPDKTQNFQGIIRNGAGAAITIQSKYGNVRFKD
ncbi:hypothetical protein CLV98_101124 [Dyadobacter jejuensis]|uniref:Uncharacterized protein n=1 Tax=Dyadobacter jejuensis TaxID=1082580 RepID=A0A316ARL1_9BACT|nr:DUF4097 family beta strand repeat-containing protein [Dyadobacter jejuensis]PWJ59949.1 hypothetical protein CLV98_101124 [Dyadobacter jejuensis]